MNEPIPAPTTPETTGQPTPPPAPPATTPLPPPVAAVVATGERTEREVELAEELAEERTHHARTASEKKAREIRVAELEDEMHRLKQAGLRPAKAATPRTASGRSWTLFDEEEN